MRGSEGNFVCKASCRDMRVCRRRTIRQQQAGLGVAGGYTTSPQLSGSLELAQESLLHGLMQDKWRETDGSACLQRCTCPGDGGPCTLDAACSEGSFVCSTSLRLELSAGKRPGECRRGAGDRLQRCVAVKQRPRRLKLSILQDGPIPEAEHCAGQVAGNGRQRLLAALQLS